VGRGEEEGGADAVVGVDFWGECHCGLLGRCYVGFEQDVF
jgi:hypothetical protein